MARPASGRSNGRNVQDGTAVHPMPANKRLFAAKKQLEALQKIQVQVRANGQLTSEQVRLQQF